MASLMASFRVALPFAFALALIVAATPLPVGPWPFRLPSEGRSKAIDPVDTFPLPSSTVQFGVWIVLALLIAREHRKLAPGDAREKAA